LVATCLVPWSVIQQRVYETSVHDIDKLRQRLLHVWHSLEQSPIDDAVDNGKRACVLVFVPMLYIFCDYQFVLSVLSVKHKVHQDELYVSHHA